MTPPIEVDEAEQRQRLERARLRLLNAAADLRPVASPEKLEARLAAALAELADVVRELELLMHIKRLEETGLESELAQLDEALAGGWTPDAMPVGDVVDKLKAQFHLT